MVSLAEGRPVSSKRTVFLAEYDGPGGYGQFRFIVGVFSSRAKAQDACRRDLEARKKNPPNYLRSSGYIITEYALDRQD